MHPKLWKWWICHEYSDVFIFKATYFKSFYTFIKPQNYIAVSYNWVGGMNQEFNVKNYMWPRFYELGRAE